MEELELFWQELLKLKADKMETKNRLSFLRQLFW